MWLNDAIRDLVRLRDFIAKDNDAAANKAAQAIKNAAQQLIETPLIGKPVNDLPSFRDLLLRFGAAGYIVRYRIEEEVIYIVHIRHYREFDFKQYD